MLLVGMDTPQLTAAAAHLLAPATDAVLGLAAQGNVHRGIDVVGQQREVLNKLVQLRLTALSGEVVRSGSCGRCRLITVASSPLVTRSITAPLIDPGLGDRIASWGACARAVATTRCSRG